MILGLKESVEQKFGRKIVYQKDCTSLSICILEETDQLLSPSTLRRFFGFLVTNSNPSLVTLDILSLYCGYKSWEDFKAHSESKSEYPNLLPSIWQTAKDRAESISEKNLLLLEHKGVSPMLKEINREFTHELFPNFFKAPQPVLPIIAPSGYGKTALLLQWYSHYSQLPAHANDIILLIPAQFLHNWVDKFLFLESWLLSILEVPSSNLFEGLVDKKNAFQGRFILLIDALDELSDSGSKHSKIYSAIEQLISNVSSQMFKVIITTRYPTWLHFTKVATSIDFNSYQPNRLDSGSANIPALNSKEIQSILDSTLDRKQDFRVLLEQLPQALRHELSYPYYLKLYTDSLGTTTRSRILTREDLIAEFIKQQVYREQYPDEKMDILNSIVSIAHQNRTRGIAKVNDLKEKYPIHLKLSGNYYYGYNQLLSSGMLSEELLENEFGLYTKRVYISNASVWEFLLVQQLIEQNGGISIALFQSIERDYAECPCLANLTILLYALTYKFKVMPVLEAFFDLTEHTLKQVFKNDNLLHVIISDEQQKNHLVSHYASNIRAKKYFFEQFKDLNTLASTSRVLPINYLNNAAQEAEKEYANTLIRLSNAYRLNFKWVHDFVNNANNTSPCLGFSIFAKGAWFSCSLLANFVSRNDLTPITDAIDQYAKQHFSDNVHNRSLFELSLVMGFLFSKQFEILHNRIERYLGERLNHPETPEEHALAIYSMYAQWMHSGELPKARVQQVETFLGHTPTWIEVQTKIIGNSLLSAHFFSIGQLDRAYSLLRDSIEMSNSSGYRVFEVKLLNELSTALANIGEAENAERCQNLARSIADNSNFDFALI